MRRFVIGDIHGCAKALDTLIETIHPTSTDEIVFLGDYIDRGPNSRDVVKQVIELGKSCRTVTLRGNHEIMMLGVALYGLDDKVWLANGGNATLSSYGGKLSKVPDLHIEFFRGLRPYYEIDESIFVHAGYDPALEMRHQEETTLYWMHLPNPLPEPHISGKRVFVGHTPQPSGMVMSAEHLVGIDTYCFGGGYLTAYDVTTCESIQANRHGHLRKAPFRKLFEGVQFAAKTAGGVCRKLVSGKQPDSTKPVTESAD
ncbi:Bis(5'-nucleosyl)-tetraphosphatase [symmetrical] [Rubripirellula obstinata]|uniref:Bis(5'-nucleosyl)-tetraphosphatase [symmetrical] n=1 Tax=Rubripirellula obstinata TaxID=406547 RepID=A0A5B1CBJ4_9BACT|nr:metallophosphoesterase family protein [Rubripirellula obstinata]KAA1257601.1 Bis(5'-nucleosyl)-tetraphosphatase [symmetrical] [Rubripirellula obstinata]